MIRKLLGPLYDWLFGSLEDKRRAAHRNGLDCDVCCIKVSPNGALFRTTRSLLWYCSYDVPERANKSRHKFLNIGDLSSPPPPSDNQHGS